MPQLWEKYNWNKKAHQSDNVFNSFLRHLHPGGIRTLDLFFRRSRWPLCQAARASLKKVILCCPFYMFHWLDRSSWASPCTTWRPGWASTRGPALCTSGDARRSCRSAAHEWGPVLKISNPQIKLSDKFYRSLYVLHMLINTSSKDYHKTNHRFRI
jgi:hypothetical protein